MLRHSFALLPPSCRGSFVTQQCSFYSSPFTIERASSSSIPSSTMRSYIRCCSAVRPLSDAAMVGMKGVDVPSELPPNAMVFTDLTYAVNIEGDCGVSGIYTSDVSSIWLTS